MEENKRVREEISLEASNLPGISQKVCLQNQNMESFDSDTQNWIPEEENMHDRYSCMSRYLMLMSLVNCSAYSRLPFLHDLEGILWNIRSDKSRRDEPFP
ncbi:hypothetical protein TNIN_401821 [Trichonephila inaurata madagascariensis]|uniref:Uncharacterized protein n=1 Tax=Trichonephila inaurata madagascariensis TaxID=2747483 RepID=A0A8X6J494_9ARAC|nr:hypothetical protein TNIN_401821 [Trichonephila inaurata madagascariensis]